MNNLIKKYNNDCKYILLLLLLPFNLFADDFNDAVNLYLKGFEYCQIAKNSLQSNDIKAANKALTEYLKIKKQATVIDNSILTSNKRGMKSNIKSCERVANGIQLQAGTPLLNMALSICEQAKYELKQGTEVQAQILFNEYSNLKTEAFTASPGLYNKFSIRNQVTLCDRIQHKIDRFNKKKKNILAIASSAVEQSHIYSSSCKKTLSELKANPKSRNSIISAQNNITLTEQIKQNALEDASNIQNLPEKEKRKNHTVFVSNITSGDNCIQKLKEKITSSQNTLARIERQLKPYNQSLNKALKQCQIVQKRTAPISNMEQYSQSKTIVVKLRSTFNKTQNSLKNDQNYQQHKNWNEAQRIQRNISKLKKCLSKSEMHLTASLNTLEKKPYSNTPIIVKPTTDPVTVKNRNHSVEKAIPEIIIGTIQAKAVSAEFALFYMLDGAEPDENTEIIIDDAGFNQFLYIHNANSILKIKSRDNASHRLSAQINGDQKKSKLLYLQPRQFHRTTVNWPEHSIATLHSNRPDITPSYIANIPSKNYQLLQLGKSLDGIAFELKNPNAADRGYMLLPGMDPVKISVALGETKELVITKNSEIQGKIIITGK